jgi:hypothetical protein
MSDSLSYEIRVTEKGHFRFNLQRGTENPERHSTNQSMLVRQ